MLNTLRRIVQEVTAARDLDQALDVIVLRVKKAMEVDVCSVYLTDKTHCENVLMATDGLNDEAVGMVRLKNSLGLIGLVGEREEPINLANAPLHPRYQYFPGSGEERYHAFLGVPIIHHRQLQGVLVVQRLTKKHFSEDKVTFLVTIAAQLAGAIAHAEAIGGITGLSGDTRKERGVVPLKGQSGSPGVAIGTAVVNYALANLEAIPDRSVGDVKLEVNLFKTAVKDVRKDIQSMLERMQEVLPAEDRALFDAYLLMLEGEAITGEVIRRIKQGNWASGALRETILEHIHAFDAMEDEYLRERADDVRDLGRRILEKLRSKEPQKPKKFPARTVLVGDEITASMLAEVPIKRLAGVVSKRGSQTSHVAILARAMGVSAVMGVDELPVSLMDGRSIIVDGYTGRVFINPSRTIREEFKHLLREEAELSKELRELRDKPAITPDNIGIPLYINSGLLADVTPSRKSGAEGVGLYRTEFPFMVRDRFPGEDEQFQIYRQVLKSFSPAPVTLRTLDVGGDKSLPYFPIEEDNPFLGWRGIRISLDHPEIFLVQLRAMLRASAGLNNMNLLFPMINSVAEVDDALRLLRRAHHELIDTGVSISMPHVGVMIEVPSAVYQVRELARRVNFLSIGTNDLTQYLLAVDRNNARVADLYDSLHPAVLRALQQIVDGAKDEKTPVSVCGEMAGDPAAAILLLGMGVDSLSMSAANLPRVKWVIRTFTQRKAHSLLKEALTFEYAHSVRNFLNAALEDAGLGGLVRAGR
ncbi:MAG: phosphoenolpyruvate--protein phosphotransferase [Ectothiorhodospiraceae bacterium]|nr:phosphoenolpyruvate--protein phosphotransferase [Ectothiorhodospiraceae bacterium]